MKSIAEIFDNSKELLDSITNFVDKYIGTSLLRRCNITKIVDSVTENTAYTRRTTFTVSTCWRRQTGNGSSWKRPAM